MKLINNFKQGLIHGIGFLTILAIAGISYATFNDQISEVSSGNPLKASEYNKIIQKLNAIDEKQLATAWVVFNGNGTIKDSYNISSVTHEGTGLYILNLSTPLNKENSSAVITTEGGTSTSSVGSINNSSLSSYFNDGDNTKLGINIRNLSDNSLIDRGHISVTIFGGK